MRSALKSVVATCVFALYRALDPLVHFREASVLAYHSISNDVSEISVAPGLLEQHLEALVRAGYVFVSLQDVCASLSGGTLPKKAVALTFDDGYADFASSALPLLERFNVPATVFLIGDEHAARPLLGSPLPLLTSDATQRLQTHALVTIGYHGKTHANCAKLSRAALTEEVVPRYGARYFAFAGGNYSDTAIEVVKEAGYDAAFSIKPTLVRRHSNPYLIPRMVVTKSTNIRFVVSRAAAWYRALTRTAK